MIPGQTPEATYQAVSADAGNGSLMRLAPIALHHLRSPDVAAIDMAVVHEAAKRSSLVTHPGPIAAEACAFLAHLLVVASTSFSVVEGVVQGASRAFLIGVADEYEGMLARTRADEPGVEEMCRLLRATEPEGSKERCWNWRSERLDIGSTMDARLDEYNGYPNSAGYFGSYCLDGLAMALHSVAMTDSFDAAIERCVNLLGDADSTGAIAGQIAGAMYGYRAIHPHMRSNLHDWDDGQIALRAALLVTRSSDRQGHEPLSDTAGAAACAALQDLHDLV
jgi:ADP-ribosylglycohydrolase